MTFLELVFLVPVGVGLSILVLLLVAKFFRSSGVGAHIYRFKLWLNK